MKTGVILNNIGSPDAPDTKSVRIYLRQFLMDPQVIELPYLIRFILVYFIITLFRAPKSAEKYQKIWTAQGSPLVVITKSIAEKLKLFSKTLAVETGMQFQNPSVGAALKKLIKENPDLERIYFIPMFPQYSFATTSASVNRIKSELESFKIQTKKPDQKMPEVFSLRPFYNQDFFIDQIVRKIGNFDLKNYDILLFSYHGLPAKSVTKDSQCQLNSTCCASGMARNCYRSQCFATSKQILSKLNSPIESLTTFQSRLGRGQWIQPYTDTTLVELVKENKKRVLVVCPAFTVDCLETLEEIVIENKTLFMEAGGSRFDYVPCLNDDDEWCRDLASVIEKGEHFDRL